MKIKPNAEITICGTDCTTLTLDVGAVQQNCTLVMRDGETQLEVLENTVKLPTISVPNNGYLEFDDANVYLIVVSQHYFSLDELKNYGDGQDEFDACSDEQLFFARQAAVEIFEKNANRSFVRKIGKTKDYGHDDLVQLNHGDVQELISRGYKLVSDSQVIRYNCTGAFPHFIEYEYGLESVNAQVSRACLELAAYMLRPSNRPVGATGESTDAGYIHFTTAGKDGATDIPEVNAAIAQFGRGENFLW